MTYQYIKYFPKPFLEDLIEGHVFPIVGAGFSRNAKSDDNKPSRDWDELGHYFAEDIVDYKYNGAISAFEYEYSRSKLIEKMYTALKIGCIHPDLAHKSFAKLPFQLVATTNFDYLLEESYTHLGNHFCRTIIDEEQLPIINKDIKHLNLLKIHGDLSHPSRLIATEEDYDSFLTKFPMIATYITNQFISKTVLFIGYSVDDTDIRQIFQMIKDRLGKLKRRAYTIRINASTQEINRFTRRGIKVINIPISHEKINYNEVFSKIFDELNNYWTNNIPNNATEEDSSLDLKLAKIHSTNISRLSYFSVETEDLPYFKSNFFPIFYKYGFTPVTPDDFLDSNDNYIARVQSLINISNLCLVDITNSSNDRLQEIEFLIEKVIKSQSDFHLIIAKNIDNPFSKNNFYKSINTIREESLDKIKSRVHFINFDKKLNQVDFNELENILKSISDHVYDQFDSEIANLFKTKQYDIALLMGYITFEKSLRDFYKDSRFASYKLSDRLIKDNIISSDEAPILFEVRDLRNKIAHGLNQNKLSKDTVQQYLEFFKKIQDKLVSEHKNSPHL
ncbi:SIR2 family NAD-dependent protein deacylase [Acinetobacter venetianus]|uniref:SIR2 family NAD-dependent protein deacylase n=1 Tax=Acinetobacter venetianus TaxID=52133 RepID=UPI00384D6704